MKPLLRRTFLEGALGFALLSLTGARSAAGSRDRDASEGAKIMTRDIVMLHGANEGAWCFDTFKAVFQELGWTCHAPDLIGHGTKAADAATTLVGIGMADYLAELEGFLKKIPPQPVLLGHSMGAVLAQLLAAKGLARAHGPGRAGAAIRHPAADRGGEGARPRHDGAGSLLEDGHQPRFRSRPHLHLEPRARERTARGVRQVWA